VEECSASEEGSGPDRREDDTSADARIAYPVRFARSRHCAFDESAPWLLDTHTQIKEGANPGPVEVAESIMAVWIQKGSLCNCCTSEEKLQADLNLSRSGGSSDPSEACVACICRRVNQIHIVERVEKLEAELQDLAFRD
jgi:hypothetical protein